MAGATPTAADPQSPESSAPQAAATGAPGEARCAASRPARAKFASRNFGGSRVARPHAREALQVAAGTGAGGGEGGAGGNLDVRGQLSRRAALAGSGVVTVLGQ